MTAGYDPGAPGLDEARLDAYRELFVSRLDLLNIALARDTKTPVALLEPAIVEIGDPETIWDIQSGAIRIRISGGDDLEQVEFESTITMGIEGNVGFRYMFLTHVAIYIHPDALGELPVKRQAEARERLISRINDWLTLGVCNRWDPETNTGGVVVPLASSILTAPPGTDALLDSHVVRGYRDWRYRGFGHTEMVPSLHLVIQGSIE